MKPGQKLTLWWQQYVTGRLRTPQAIVRASRSENPDETEDRFTRDIEDGEGWKRLYAPQFLSTEGYLRQSHRADWQHVDKRLRMVAARVCLRLAARGIPVYVHSAFRTESEQADLLRRKVTKVGYPFSAHNIGEAIDLVHGVYHWDLTRDEWLYLYNVFQDELRKFNAAIPRSAPGRPRLQKLVLNWGGDDGTPTDKFRWDPAHWEILGYRDRSRSLVAGDPVHLSPSSIVRFGL